MGLLRIMLAMAVLLSHLPPAPFQFIGGGLAVQGFFIVSGFYMALVLGGKYSDVGLFYSNRLLRLLPSYFVMLAIAAAALFGLSWTVTFSREGFIGAYQHPATAAFFVFEHIAIMGQDLLFWFQLTPDGALVLDPANTPPSDTHVIGWQPLLVPQSWSLSLELLFYLCAPFLARRGWRALAAICAASIALRFAGHALPLDYGLWQGRLFPTSLFLFVLGMLSHRTLPLVTRLSNPLLGWGVAIALYALIAGLPLLKLDDEIGRWLVYAAIAAAIPFIFAASNNVAFDRWIGDLSYPLYLTHLVVIAGVLITGVPRPVLVAIGGSLALSALLLVLVDRPVDRWRQARAAAPRAASAVRPPSGTARLLAR
jgi:peptidoglycan/LPS O-acetylase OafA/YrhL